MKRRWLVAGRPVTPRSVRVRSGHAGLSLIDVTLAEGRHHVVRKWCEAMGLKVDRLARLSYGPIRPGDLPVGKSRPLTEEEIEAVYRAIRLDPVKEE